MSLRAVPLAPVPPKSTISPIVGSYAMDEPLRIDGLATGDCGAQLVGDPVAVAEEPTAGTMRAVTRQVVPSTTQIIRAGKRKGFRSVLQLQLSMLPPHLSLVHRWHSSSPERHRTA